MDDPATTQAVMTISVDQKLQVATHYRGHPGLILGMLGGIEYARAWCIDQLREREVSLCSDGKSKQNILVTLPRDEALKEYYAAYNTLRDRIGAITKASSDATFQVPSSLHSL